MTAPASSDRQLDQQVHRALARLYAAAISAGREALERERSAVGTPNKADPFDKQCAFSKADGQSDAPTSKVLQLMGAGAVDTSTTEFEHKRGNPNGTQQPTTF
jgi:hypothetical protein